MAYANIEDDVAKILPPGMDVPSGGSREEQNLLMALEESTDLIIGHLSREWSGDDADSDGVPDDVPGAVRRVCARVALRAFLNEPSNPGAESEVQLMGPFSHTINWSKEAQAHDFYLTNSDEVRLHPYHLYQAGAAAFVPMASACGDTSWYDRYEGCQ